MYTSKLPVGHLRRRRPLGREGDHAGVGGGLEAAAVQAVAGPAAAAAVVKLLLVGVEVVTAAGGHFLLLLNTFRGLFLLFLLKAMSVLTRQQDGFWQERKDVTQCRSGEKEKADIFFFLSVTRANYCFWECLLSRSAGSSVLTRFWC